MQQYLIDFSVVCFSTGVFACVLVSDVAEASPSSVAHFYSISLPSQLFFSKVPESRDCMFVQRRTGAKKSRHVAMICVEALNHRDVLSKNGFFVQNSNWVIGGSMDIGQAKIEFKQDSVSIHGQTSCGVSDNAGIHAAGGLCYSFLTFSSHHAVSVQSTGNEKDIADFARLADLITLAVKPSAEELRNIFQNTSD